jgi:glutaredoxin
MEPSIVKGEKRGKIVLYGLSTCGWCKKTKKFLNKLGVEYQYIDVDLLDDEQHDKIAAEVAKWNPNRNYPTVVINDTKCIVGYKENDIKEALHV